MCSSIEACASFLTGWIPRDPLKYVPVITPALKEHGCAVDQGLLAERVLFVVFAALGLAFVGALVSVIFPVAGCVIILGAPTAYLLPGVDAWMSERAADRKAVNEYLQQPFPSKEATGRIQTSVNAAKLLVREKANLDKLNIEGESLLSGIRDSGVLHVLVEGGIAITARLQSDRSYFERLMRYDDTRPCAEVLLKTQKVLPADFTVQEQQQLWLSMRNMEAATLLKQYGFDVNVQDEEGYTALMRVVNDHRGPRWALAMMERKTLVACLLNSGAHRSVTLTNGTQLKATDLTTDSALLAILNQT